MATKLYNPPIQSGLVRRQELVRRLENGYQAGRSITFVSAPAGFGKTTLICEWIATSAPCKPFGWVSLDPGDNDPIRFLIYLVSAIQKVHGEIGRSILSALQSSQTPSVTDLAESLINEIASAAKPFLLILDDYHLIQKAEVHSLMQLFLKRQPFGLHWVVITREDPPLPLPRMRVQGQITEIRERDLRFSLSEAQAFLRQTMGLDLSSEDVDKLEERTEGWAAGMQLAALALEEYPNEIERSAFIEAFAGSNRYIVDYLISEVLQRQDETTRQFLLHTSVLERFCSELCDQVVFGEGDTGRSQPILDALEQGNMFLVPLDDQRHWYRYHHLFTEMLFHSLRRSSPEQIPVLHHQAGLWFEAKGFIPEAVKHAQASKDWDFVGSLLSRYALSMLFQGYGRMVIEWYRDFPRSYLERTPDICIKYAWALVLTFRNDFLHEVEEKLQMAARAVEDPDLPAYAPVGEGGTRVPYRDWVIGQTCVIRSQALLGTFNTYIDPQEFISLSLKGLELLPAVERTFRSLCKINLAHAELMQNNPAGAQKAFDEALPYMLEAGNYLGAVAAVFYQARLALYMVHIDSAEMVCREWKKKFAEMAGSSTLGSQPIPEIPAARGLDVVQSLILLERNQIDEAEDLLVKTLEFLGWGSWMELHGFVELARLQHLHGKYPQAADTLQRMSRLGPQHAACAEALEILFELQRSSSEPRVRSRAETWTKTHPLISSECLALGIGPYHRDTEYFCNLTWARIQIALGHPQAALIFVGPSLESALECGLAFRVAELSIAQALIFEQLGNSSAALDKLERALEISERCGYTRVFCDSPELNRLLQKAVERKTHAPFAKQLIISLGQMQLGEKAVAPGPQKDCQTPGMVENLSERELEVLRHLATGSTPAEVAKRLFLSPFTLKAHTQNIYSKLNVHSRIEAINKARELQLI